MSEIIDFEAEREVRDFPRCAQCQNYEAGRCARLNTSIEAEDTCRFHSDLVDGPGAST